VKALRAVILVLSSVVLAWGLAASSGVAIPWHPADATVLRLSWSARPERIETCRTLSEAELAERPVHMQQRVVCEGTTASYALLVTADGDTLDEAVIRGGGLRGDRAIYLLRSYAVSAGARHVRLRFSRREAVDSITTQNALPAELVLDTAIVFRAGEVQLVTIAGGAFRLVAP
jgi:hypothetical protein